VIDGKIRFKHRVTCAARSSDNARWTVDTEADPRAPVRFNCDFLYLCSGYYPLRPREPIVHPQH